VEIGRGRIAPGDVAGILLGRERSAAGRTMPPEGLYLEWIHYPTEQVEPADPARSGEGRGEGGGA
jgi:tRNA U38,U39,U40 pseudouridine synthase TruA